MASLFGPAFFLVVVALSPSTIGHVSSTVVIESNSFEACNMVRNGTLKVLAMGSKGFDTSSNHRFYLLAEGGYLFSVPFTNLALDPQNIASNKLIIDEPYQLAGDLFNETPESFTSYSRESGNNYTSFFFISNPEDEHFLVKLTEDRNTMVHCFQLYNLEGGKPKPPRDCHWNYINATQFVLSIESEVPGYYPVAHAIEMMKADDGWNATWIVNLIGNASTISESGRNKKEILYKGRVHLNHKEILTAFFTNFCNHTNMPNCSNKVFLSSNGTVIVVNSPLTSDNYSRMIEKPLSQFLECKPLGNVFLWLLVIAFVVIILGFGGYYAFKKSTNGQGSKASKGSSSPIAKKEKSKSITLGGTSSNASTKTLQSNNASKSLPTASTIADTSSKAGSQTSNGGNASKRATQ